MSAKTKVLVPMTLYMARVCVAVVSVLALTACSEELANPVSPPAEDTTSLPRRPATIEIVSGDGQTIAGQLNTEQPLIVRVADAQGRPLQGVLVRWSAPRPALIAEPAESVTDASGVRVS